MTWLWIGLGGFLGANLRYWLSSQMRDRYGVSFPWGTFVVNLSGSFLIGFLMMLLVERSITDPVWRMFAIVGFLGGYTTFSAYTFESVTLMEQGHWDRALLYIVGSNVLGLLACYLGMTVARSLA